MVESQVVSITPAQHADAHRHGGTDPLTGDVRIDMIQFDPNVNDTVTLDDTASGDHLTIGGAYGVLNPVIDKVINLPAGQTYDLGITFSMHEVSNLGTIKIKIYRNGAAVGTERSINFAGSPVSHSEVISGWVDGDHLQIYGYHNNGGNGKVYDMKIYGGGNLKIDPTWT